MLISIAHTKGGVGKSTIALNLAIQLQDEYNIEIVDLDFQQTVSYTNRLRDKALKVKSFDSLKKLEKYILNDKDSRISIIDVGGFDSDINRMAIIMSDIVITPVSDGATEILGLIRFEKILDEISKTMNENIKTMVLINNIDPKKRKLDDLIDYIKENKHFNLFKTVLRRRADYGKALDKGLGVIEYDKKSKASKEFISFSKEVEKTIKKVIS